VLTATQSYSPKVFGNLPNARAALRAGNESETHRQLMDTAFTYTYTSSINGLLCLTMIRFRTQILAR
jgi:hypothetical protein